MHCYYLYKLYGLTENSPVCSFQSYITRPNLYWTDPLELWTGLNISFIIRVVFVGRGRGIGLVWQSNNLFLKFHLQLQNLENKSLNSHATAVGLSRVRHNSRRSTVTPQLQCNPGAETENYPRSWAVGIAQSKPLDSKVYAEWWFLCLYVGLRV